MLELTRSRLTLRIAEVYFFDGKQHPIPDVDVLFLHQTLSRCDDCTEFHTLHLDLRRTEADLLRGFGDTHRYEINRALRRDALKSTIYREPSADLVIQFSKFYDRFAKGKSLLPSSTRKLSDLQGLGALWISRVADQEGIDLCWHAHIVDGHRTRLLYSSSLFRESEDSARKSLIGRANRYLHWAEIQTFKQEGLAVYDFGGISGAGGNSGIRIASTSSKCPSVEIKSPSTTAFRPAPSRAVSPSSSVALREGVSRMCIARYIYRLDDITPGMDWDEFWKFIELFKRYQVRPLLGVVPNNCDPALTVRANHPAFWSILRQLVAEEVVEIAQHGYQHVYETQGIGMLGRTSGFKPQSEFVGLPVRSPTEEDSGGTSDSDARKSGDRYLDGAFALVRSEHVKSTGSTWASALSRTASRFTRIDDMD